MILLFFTVESGSRLEYYSFGAWPAMALLLGLGIADAEEADKKWLKPVQRVLAALAVVLARLPDIFSGGRCTLPRRAMLRTISNCAARKII